MRDLHGVLFSGHNDLRLKQRALLFDKFHLWHLADEEGQPPEAEAELAFLRDRGVVADAPSFDINAFAESLEQIDFKDGFAVVRSLEGSLPQDEVAELTMMSARDLVNRYLIKSLVPGSNSDLVPICELALPVSEASPRSSDVISIAFTCLPFPDDSCAWEDVLAFKVETRDKQWAFRRFIRALATKAQSESEIRDEIEWSLNEYRKAMQIHQIKVAQSFVDVFVITPIEIIENLVKFNWSKIAKGALQVRKRKVELLEAEMKAPGRECAYVFDARNRFGA